jgi:hypothetical protein
MIKMLMACERKNTGKQVGAPYYDWADYAQPILPASPIHKDISEWNYRADCICLTVYPDESTESMESQFGFRLKTLSRSL